MIKSLNFTEIQTLHSCNTSVIFELILPFTFVVIKKGSFHHQNIIQMNLQGNSNLYPTNVDFAKIFNSDQLGQTIGNKPKITFQKGTYIFLPDENAQNIYFLTEGKVKTGNYGPTGKEITKNITGAGEVFGELALFNESGKRRDFAIASEKTTAYVISKEDLKRLMKYSPELMLFLMSTIGNKKIEMERRLESLYFKDSRARIIEFLYNFGTTKGERIGFETVVRRHMTHQEIANLTATSRQTVTTVLNELRNRNIITFNRRRFLIRNMETLGREGLIAV